MFIFPSVGRGKLEKTKLQLTVQDRIKDASVISEAALQSALDLLKPGVSLTLLTLLTLLALDLLMKRSTCLAWKDWLRLLHRTWLTSIDLLTLGVLRTILNLVGVNLTLDS